MIVYVAVSYSDNYTSASPIIASCNHGLLAYFSRNSPETRSIERNSFESMVFSRAEERERERKRRRGREKGERERDAKMSRRRAISHTVWQIG